MLGAECAAVLRIFFPLLCFSHHSCSSIRLAPQMSEVERILSACSSNDCSLFGAECAAVLKATAEQMGLGKKSEAFAITR